MANKGSQKKTVLDGMVRWVICTDVEEIDIFGV